MGSFNRMVIEDNLCKLALKYCKIRLKVASVRKKLLLVMLCCLFIFRYKEEFRKLSEDERSSIGVENQKFLRDFDAESPQMEFHHLPQKPSRMEFHLVMIADLNIHLILPTPLSLSLLRRQ